MTSTVQRAEVFGKESVRAMCVSSTVQKAEVFSKQRVTSRV